MNSKATANNLLMGVKQGNEATSSTTRQPSLPAAELEHLTTPAYDLSDGVNALNESNSSTMGETNGTRDHEPDKFLAKRKSTAKKTPHSAFPFREIPCLM